MRVQHGLGFVAGQVAELDAEVTAGGAVGAGGGEEDMGVEGDEVFGEVTGGAEIEEFEFFGGGVEEEVCPVGVCLHEFKFCDFAQAEVEDLSTDPVFLLLVEVPGFGDAGAMHKVHGEDLGPGGGVMDRWDDEDVGFVVEEVLEAFAACCFAEVVAFPCEFGAGVCDGFVKVEAFG